MEYAPFIVPTLCRYEHFKRLIESLQVNPEAKFTDLFIALDYPAKSSHWDGYRKISNYVDTITGFKQVHVVRREHNYGVSNNIKDIIDFVSEHYKAYIFSEDDNFFSPNFLAFINHGLEKFKDDPTVYSINGYRHFYDIKYDDNNYFFENVDFSAWGYGVWVERYNKFRSEMTYLFVLRAFLNPVKFHRIITAGWQKVLDFFNVLLRFKRPGSTDSIISLYLAITGKNCVVPTISKVRNEGWDETGNSFDGKDVPLDLAAKHLNQEIDNESSFDFHGDGHNYYDYNKKIFVAQNYMGINFGKFISKFFAMMIRKIIHFSQMLFGKRKF